MAGGKSTTQNTSVADNRTLDERMAADGEAIVTRAGGDVIINKTSQEAVQLGSAYANAATDIVDLATLSNQRVSERSISTMGAALDDSLTFGREAVYEASDTARRSLDESLDFGREAIFEVSDTSRRSMLHSADTLDSALYYNEGATLNAFGFAGDALGAVSGALSETLMRANSESTQLSEKLIKIGVPALALVFIAQAMRK